MTEDGLKDLLKELMRQGLRIEMFMENGQVWYDLNTGMKSHLHIRYDNIAEEVCYRGRYEVTGTIDDMQDLLWAVRRCDHGRGFANSVWFDILEGDNGDD